MMTMIYDLRNQKNLPQSPEVYAFKDEEGKVLYIGKSMNLKSRVSIYFQVKSHGKATSKMDISL